MNKKLEWKVDTERGKEVAHRIIGMMQRKVYPFDRERIYPDAIIPDGCDKAWYNFYAGFMDYRTDSHKMYQELRNLASQEHGLQMLTSESRFELSEVLRKYFPQSIGSFFDNKRRNAIIDALLFNNQMLEEQYEGNPRNIKTNDVEETQKRIAKFKLYGIHKAALFTKNMVRFEIWDFSPYEIPIKIDRHAARIFAGTGIVRFYQNGTDVDYRQLSHGEFRNEPVRRELRKAFMQITREEKISAVDLNDGTWAIGNVLCKRNNRVYCRINCDLDCAARPSSPDSHGSVFSLGVDKRKDQSQLTLF